MFRMPVLLSLALQQTTRIAPLISRNKPSFGFFQNGPFSRFIGWPYL